MTISLLGQTNRSAKPWSARPPTGVAILLALPFLLLLFGALEIVVRQPAVHDRLGYPRMGSRHGQLGSKYARLQTLVLEVGHVECIAIGSSTVDQAFNPIAFAAAFQAETERSLTCFNFAIDAIVPAASHQIAAILIADFQPDLLIVGTDARDLTIAENEWDVTVITETPWVRYRSGQFSVRGWLTEHIYVYRYGQQIKQLIQGNLAEALRPVTPPAIALGQNPKAVTGWRVGSGEIPNQDEALLTYYRDRLGDFRILPENTAGLRQIMNINSPHTQVIVVEMPVTPDYLRFFRDPDADYDAFLTHLHQLAYAHHTPFWTTLELNLIPDDGWFDFSHVNVVGADIFSAWLGHKVGVLSHGQ